MDRVLGASALMALLPDSNTSLAAPPGRTTDLALEGLDKSKLRQAAMTFVRSAVLPHK
jgi:hypothetical protein